MIISRKVGHATFHHDDEFKGEVTIDVSVSMESLRGLVAESIRYELANHIAKMKPADLLRRIA